MKISNDKRLKRALKVLKIVEKFAKDQEILGPECVHQSDRVIENAYNFIEELVTAADAYVPLEDE